MGVSKTSDHIQIKIKMPNPSQEPPASSKAQNEDLKDMDVLCTFKIKIESHGLHSMVFTLSIGFGSPKVRKYIVFGAGLVLDGRLGRCQPGWRISQNESVLMFSN